MTSIGLLGVAPGAEPDVGAPALSSYRRTQPPTIMSLPPESRKERLCSPILDSEKS